MRSRLARPGRRPRLAGASVGVCLAALLVIVLAAGVARGSATATPPGNTSPPTISGTAQQNQTLTASTGVWIGDAPITYTYQWQRCDNIGSSCGSLVGANGQTLVVSASDVGGTLRVVVTATNASGVASAASGPTTVVAAAGSAPSPSRQPDPHGVFVVGQTINVDTGTWTGSGPISFSFQWQRCAVNGGSCADVPGATAQTYLLAAADIGLRLRAIVKGTNSVGSASIASNLTGVIVTSGSPVSTRAPSIGNPGALRVGDLAIGSIGVWSGNQPITYAYSWNRCDGAGRNCGPIAGQVGTSYRIAGSDAGATLIFTVRATSPGGSTTANSAPTAPIAFSNLPPGGIQLGDGKVSIPVTSVALPQRLVVSSVKFTPSVIRSRSTFSARFRVTDTRGYAVRDALVFVLGLPYGYVRGAPELRTGVDGYVVVDITPTAGLPLRRGAIVFFVRARKPGGSLLAGVSTRRLVQVTVRG